MTVDFSDKYIDLLKSALCSSLYEESAWRLVEGPTEHYVSEGTLSYRIVAKMKHAILRSLRKRNLRLVRTLPFNPASREIGADWPLFGFTMTGRRRLDALHRCVDEILRENIPGDFAETGVWRGGSVILMRALLSAWNDTERLVWCADSFEGMPEPTVVDKTISSTSDFSGLEYLAVSLEQVKNNFARFGLLDGQVKFLKGWFSDTLPTAPIKQLSLLRLDGDLYQSTQDALTNLYHKVSSGGYVIVDDYNSWDGCHAAVDEFRKQRDITEPIQKIDADAVLWQVSAR